jgi:hypothetical protein
MRGRLKTRGTISEAWKKCGRIRKNPDRGVARVRKEFVVVRPIGAQKGGKLAVQI